MRLCVIPARGGSKRIPRKNIRPFCGKPMIQWSIEAAKASGVFDRIIVSTDDDEIADAAASMGAEVPFRRPAELSDDHATTIAVIAHAVDWMKENGATPDAVCCLYATAPFVRGQDLAAGLDALAGVDWVVPVTTFASPIQRALRQDAAGGLTMFDQGMYQTRSQDLEEAWHDVGQFYWATPDAWRSDTKPYEAPTRALVLPRHRVQDIDTPEDWARAERIVQAFGSDEPGKAGSFRT